MDNLDYAKILFRQFLLNLNIDITNEFFNSIIFDFLKKGTYTLYMLGDYLNNKPLLYETSKAPSLTCLSVSKYINIYGDVTKLTALSSNVTTNIFNYNELEIKVIYNKIISEFEIPYSNTSTQSLYTPQVMPGYCPDNKGKFPEDCYMGGGMCSTTMPNSTCSSEWAQYGYIGPFCQTQLQNASTDPKTASSCAWGGGSNFGPQNMGGQALPYPYYYYDKYRALVMLIGQESSGSCKGPTEQQNSLGYGSCELVKGCGTTSSDLITKANIPKGKHDSPPPFQNLDISAQSCLNYLAFSAIKHATQICNVVKNDMLSEKISTVPPLKSLGPETVNIFDEDYYMGVPKKYWDNKYFKHEYFNTKSLFNQSDCSDCGPPGPAPGPGSTYFCPKDTVCLPGPKFKTKSNPQIQSLGDIDSDKLGADVYEDWFKYDVSTTVYDPKLCQFDHLTSSAYDIAQIWLTTFPKSDINTCAAALISTQGECITGDKKPTIPSPARHYPGQPNVCSTTGGDSGGGIWQVTTPMGYIPKSCLDKDNQVKNDNLCCSAVATAPHIISTSYNTNWSDPLGWSSGTCMMHKNTPPKPGSTCPPGFTCKNKLKDGGKCNQIPGAPTCYKAEESCCLTGPTPPPPPSPPAPLCKTYYGITNPCQGRVAITTGNMCYIKNSNGVYTCYPSIKIESNCTLLNGTWCNLGTPPPSPPTPVPTPCSSKNICKILTGSKCDAGYTPCSPWPGGEYSSCNSVSASPTCWESCHAGGMSCCCPSS